MSKSAVDAVKAIGQALRKQLEEQKKLLKNEKNSTARDAALKLKDELRQQVMNVYAELVKMQAKEGNLDNLNKISSFSMPSTAESEHRKKIFAAIPPKEAPKPAAATAPARPANVGAVPPPPAAVASPSAVAPTKPSSKVSNVFARLKGPTSSAAPTNSEKEARMKLLASVRKDEGLLTKSLLVKKTPPDVSEDLMHKLKDQYGHDEKGKEKAYATAWKIHNAKKAEESLDEVSHKESSQKEASADKHMPAAEAKKGKTAAFVPGPGKMVKEEASKAEDASHGAWYPGAGEIKKGVDGLPESNPAEAHAQAKYGSRQTVFDVLRAKQPLPVAKGTEDELKERDSQVFGSVLPNDKPVSKKAQKKDSGSGGQLVKEKSLKGPASEKVGEPAIKAEVPAKQDPSKKDDGSGGEINAEVKKATESELNAKRSMTGSIEKKGLKKVDVPEKKDPSKEDKGSGGEVENDSNVKKSASVPAKQDPSKKDDGSGGEIKKEVKKGELSKQMMMSAPKMMQQHGMIEGSKQAAMQAKDAKMPAGQKMKPSMPSPSQHAARADMFSGFMPKGAFNKDELMKDIESVERLYKGKK